MASAKLKSRSELSTEEDTQTDVTNEASSSDDGSDLEREELERIAKAKESKAKKREETYQQEVEKQKQLKPGARKPVEKVKKAAAVESDDDVSDIYQETTRGKLIESLSGKGVKAKKTPETIKLPKTKKKVEKVESESDKTVTESESEDDSATLKYLSSGIGRCTGRKPSEEQITKAETVFTNSLECMGCDEGLINNFDENVQRYVMLPSSADPLDDDEKRQVEKAYKKLAEAWGWKLPPVKVLPSGNGLRKRMSEYMDKVHPRIPGTPRTAKVMAPTAGSTHILRIKSVLDKVKTLIEEGNEDKAKSVLLNIKSSIPGTGLNEEYKRLLADC